MTLVDDRVLEYIDEHDHGSLKEMVEEGLSYPSTRKPTGALEDLQNKMRAYKTE